MSTSEFKFREYECPDTRRDNRTGASVDRKKRFTEAYLPGQNSDIFDIIHRVHQKNKLTFGSNAVNCENVSGYQFLFKNTFTINVLKNDKNYACKIDENVGFASDLASDLDKAVRQAFKIVANKPDANKIKNLWFDYFALIICLESCVKSGKYNDAFMITFFGPEMPFHAVNFMLLSQYSIPQVLCNSMSDWLECVNLPRDDNEDRWVGKIWNVSGKKSIYSNGATYRSANVPSFKLDFASLLSGGISRDDQTSISQQSSSKPPAIPEMNQLTLTERPKKPKTQMKARVPPQETVVAAASGTEDESDPSEEL